MPACTLLSSDARKRNPCLTRMTKQRLFQRRTHDNSDTKGRELPLPDRALNRCAGVSFATCCFREGTQWCRGCPKRGRLSHHDAILGEDCTAQAWHKNDAPSQWTCQAATLQAYLRGRSCQPLVWQNASELACVSSRAKLPVKTKSTTRGRSLVTWKRARLEPGSAELLSWSFPGPPPRLRLELMTTASWPEARSSNTSSVRLWKWGVLSPR